MKRKHRKKPLDSNLVNVGWNRENESDGGFFNDKEEKSSKNLHNNNTKGNNERIDSGIKYL